MDDLYVKLKHLLFFSYYFPKNRDVIGLFHLLHGLINKKMTPYRNYDKIIAIEKKYNATSTFFFLASPEDIFGTKYSLDDVYDDLTYIQDSGCEIGYHTGYNIYNEPEKIQFEKHNLEKVLGKKVFGTRNHVLRFQTPTSWEVLAQAGFEYDTSFGYHDMIGFRNGMCHPFQPFNLTTNQSINITEIPLHIQDWTLFMFMKLNEKDRWLYIKNLIDVAAQQQGTINLLWHTWTFSLPISLGCIFGKEWTKLYEKILKYCLEKNAWITNCKELYTYYHSNGFFTEKII